MKLLIASDIHGSAYYCRKLIEAYKTENADRLLLLGDLLYHGPRNDLPTEYAPKAVIGMLNELKDDLLCVRGNCDTEVDQMVLDFPIMADYAWIFDGDTRMFLTHGHKFSPDSPPPLSEGDVLVYGHTHIPENALHGNFLAVNPGSVSIPKNGSSHSAVIYENGVFTHIDI